MIGKQIPTFPQWAEASWVFFFFFKSLYSGETKEKKTCPHQSASLGSSSEGKIDQSCRVPGQSRQLVFEQRHAWWVNVRGDVTGAGWRAPLLRLSFHQTQNNNIVRGGYFSIQTKRKKLSKDACLTHAFLTMCCLSQYLWTCLGSNSATRLMTSRENLNLIGAGAGGTWTVTEGLRSPWGLALPFTALVWLVAFSGVVCVRWSVIHLKGGEETGC